MRASQLIDRYLAEGKASLFDRLKSGDTFHLPGKPQRVYKKVDSGRAIAVDDKRDVLDVLPADFVIRVDEVVGPTKPRRKSLAQKQGARKGGRTRQCRQYAEDAPGSSNGWLHYYYYHRKHPEVAIDRLINGDPPEKA